MKSIEIEEFERETEGHLYSVIHADAPLRVSRPQGDVVVMPLSHLRGLEETLHLMSSPANASHLKDSMESIESGKYQVKDIDEI